MSYERKIRWGIIGPGRIARDFAADAKYCRHGEIAAVASRSEKRARDFAMEFGVRKHFGDYGSLFQDPGIDAVYVATPHNFHFEQSMEGLRAGKAVLSEKPLTDQLTDTKALVEFAREQDVYLMEGMWTYFLPAIQKAKRWVDEGRIGAVRHVKADFGFALQYDPLQRHFNPDLAGGSLLDLGIYPIAFSWLFLQEDPEAMKVISRRAPNGVDSDVNMLFEYETATANLHASFDVGLRNSAFIYGDQGYIEIPTFWHARECTLFQEGKRTERFRDKRKGIGFSFEMESVSCDLQEGKKESSVMPLANSLKFAEIMDRVMQHFDA